MSIVADPPLGDEFTAWPLEDEDTTGPACKPFLRWTGSKTQLLPVLREFAPKRFSLYAEPFIGGGALFFDRRPRHATLADANPLLVRTYKAVAREVDAVIAALRTYADGHARCLAAGTDAALYYHVRKTVDPNTMDDANVAAWFIYLNKTNFNGLWRVNSSGKYNVPYGKRKNPLICDETTLRACAEAMQRASIVHQDFRETSAMPPGSFCYMDCPYWPVSTTSNFTAYTAGSFSWKDQTDLRDLAFRLKRRGVHVLLSNSDTPAIRGLYKDDFELIAVQARRSVAASAAARAPVDELLIR